jgi:uncharacterized membrane protein YdbT with pleckstrin-like domain
MINTKPWALALILGLSSVTVACGGENEQNVEDSNPSGIQSEEDDENEAQPEGQSVDQAEDETQDGDNNQDEDEEQEGDDD